jgi:hypothetical protein
MKVTSELKTILAYISSGQTDRLAQSEWKNVANKLLNKEIDTFGHHQSISTETYNITNPKKEK